MAIDSQGQAVAHSHCKLPASSVNGRLVEQQPEDWWQAARSVLAGLSREADLGTTIAIAVDGTSSTLLLTDNKGNPRTAGIMYNDARATEDAGLLEQLAETQTGAQGSSCSLAKLMWLHRHGLDQKASFLQGQADWIAARLCGVYGHSDYNNALKLGYDAVNLCWPAWMDELPIDQKLLPRVGAPGDTLGKISKDIAAETGLSPETVIKLGTTDSIAAFLATGANRPAQAVTSLGSTLVLKVLSEEPVFSAAHGVYSHRLGELWLVGGASNSGGAALLQYFLPEEMATLTPRLDPDHPTGLDYYPLPATGERFPANNPHMRSRVVPLAEDRLTLFQGLLEGIAKIEARGYRLLQELGAPFPNSVISCGGGATNPGWRRIRENHLGVPVTVARNIEAAYGTALLAKGIK